MRQVISVLVRNHPGVLSHVAGLFTRRAYNIESIAAGITERPDVTRITLVVSGDEAVLEQVTKQLRKLVDVIGVIDLKYSQSVTRELILMTVYLPPDKRVELVQVANSFGASIVDISDQTATLGIFRQRTTDQYPAHGPGPFQDQGNSPHRVDRLAAGKFDRRQPGLLGLDTFPLKKILADIAQSQKTDDNTQHQFDEFLRDEFLGPGPQIHADKASGTKEKTQEPVRSGGQSGLGGDDAVKKDPGNGSQKGPE